VCEAAEAIAIAEGGAFGGEQFREYGGYSRGGGGGLGALGEELAADAAGLVPADAPADVVVVAALRDCDGSLSVRGSIVAADPLRTRGGPRE
jgi:hypothetical protein